LADAGRSSPPPSFHSPPSSSALRFDIRVPLALDPAARRAQT
jgi:hypothetical protein